MLIVPLQAVPNQTVTVTLNNQLCQINVYQKTQGLFVDLYSSNVLVIGGVIAENRNRIVRSLYLGFQGDIFFIDNEGDTDPIYTGLGGRYSLAYATPAELGGAG